MKKWIVLVSVLAVLLMGLSACTAEEAPPAAADPPPPADAPAADPPPADDNGEEAPPAGPVDWANFVLDPSPIPQEKLDTEVHLAVSVRGLDNPYIVTKIEGMHMFSEWLDSIGQRNVTHVLDSGGSNDVEINNMRSFAALAGGNALAYSDPNEDAIAPALAEAIAEAGGFFGTGWGKPPGIGPMDFTPNWVTHISPDNIAAGYDSAVALFESMGGEGYVFVVEGMLGNAAANNRRVGFDRALAEFPGITVAHEDTGNWLTSEALNLVETWLIVTPDVGGIWCANDNMAMGALQALNNAGLLGEVGVTGVDAITEMVEEVRLGNAVATVSAHGHLKSSYTLAWAYAAWTGLLDVEALPLEFREFATPSLLITADNVEYFVANFIESAPVFDFTNLFYAKAGPLIM